MHNMGAESQSVARAVDILELLAENGSLGVRDIARRMTLSPTIVHRLLSTLASTGFAEQAPAARIGQRLRVRMDADVDVLAIEIHRLMRRGELHVEVGLTTLPSAPRG